MMDGNNDDRGGHRSIDDRVGKATHDALPVFPVNLAKCCGTEANRLNRGVHGPRKLGTETGDAVGIPAPSLQQLGPSLGPKNDARPH